MPQMPAAGNRPIAFLFATSDHSDVDWIVAADCPAGPREKFEEAQAGRLVAVDNVAAMREVLIEGRGDVAAARQSACVPMMWSALRDNTLRRCSMVGHRLEGVTVVLGVSLGRAPSRREVELN